jgi:hemerythrin
MNDDKMVEWTNRYVLGIPGIDVQHKKLIEITNTLFSACRRGTKHAKRQFFKAVREVVDYIRYHFASEEKLLERLQYPGMEQHKLEHAQFVRDVVAKVQDFKNGKKFAPNLLARYLRDWILSHVAMTDKDYADYLFSLRAGNFQPSENSLGGTAA